MIKKIILFITAGLLSVSCSNNEESIIGNKLPIKVEFIDYYTTNELTDDKIYNRFLVDYIYEEGKIIEEKHTLDGKTSTIYKYSYLNGKISKREGYDINNILKEEDIFTYENGLVKKVKNYRKSYTNPTLFDETIYHYTYDSNNRIIEQKTEGKFPFTYKYEHLSDNKVKVIIKNGEYHLNTYDGKKGINTNFKEFGGFFQIVTNQGNLLLSKYYLNNDLTSENSYLNKYDNDGYLVKTTLKNPSLFKGHTFVTKYIYNK